MVHLVGERRSGRHVHHEGGSLVFVPRRQRQQFRTPLPRRDLALLATQLRQGRGDLVEDRPGEDVIPFEGQVDVFVEEVFSGLRRRSADPAPSGRFRQGPARRRRNGRSTMATWCPVACAAATSRTMALMRESARNRSTSRSRASSNRCLASAPAAGLHQAAGHAELEFREAVVDFLRRLVLPGRLLPAIAGFQPRRPPGRSTPISPIPRRRDPGGAARPAADSLAGSRPRCKGRPPHAHGGRRRK